MRDPSRTAGLYNFALLGPYVRNAGRDRRPIVGFQFFRRHRERVALRSAAFNIHVSSPLSMKSSRTTSIFSKCGSFQFSRARAKCCWPSSSVNSACKSNVGEKFTRTRARSLATTNSIQCRLFVLIVLIVNLPREIVIRAIARAIKMPSGTRLGDLQSRGEKRREKRGLLRVAFLHYLRTP